MPVGAQAGLPAAAVVQEPVVSTTDQTGVAEGRGATVSPPEQVMALGPTGGPIAARKNTTAIAQDQGAAQRAGEQAPGAAEVKGQAVAVKDGG